MGEVAQLVPLLLVSHLLLQSRDLQLVHQANNDDGNEDDDGDDTDNGDD